MTSSSPSSKLQLTNSFFAYFGYRIAACNQPPCLYMCLYVRPSQYSRSFRQCVSIHCTCELLELFYIFFTIYLSFCMPKKRDKSQHSGDRHYWRRINIWGKSAIAYLLFQDVCISFRLFRWQQRCVRSNVRISWQPWYSELSTSTLGCEHKHWWYPSKRFLVLTHTAVSRDSS